VPTGWAYRGTSQQFPAQPYAHSDASVVPPPRISIRSKLVKHQGPTHLVNGTCSIVVLVSASDTAGIPDDLNA